MFDKHTITPAAPTQNSISSERTGEHKAIALPSLSLSQKNELEATTSNQEAYNLAGKTLDEIERIALEQTLLACRGNKAKSARMLGISEKSVYNKIKRLGVIAPTFPEESH